METLIHLPIREEAQSVLQVLKAHDKHLILATGDTETRTVEAMESLPFDEIYTDLDPEEKYQIIERIHMKNATF